MQHIYLCYNHSFMWLRYPEKGERVEESLWRRWGQWAIDLCIILSILIQWVNCSTGIRAGISAELMLSKNWGAHLREQIYYIMYSELWGSTLQKYPHFKEEEQRFKQSKAMISRSSYHLRSLSRGPIFFPSSFYFIEVFTQYLSKTLQSIWSWHPRITGHFWKC